MDLNIMNICLNIVVNLVNQWFTITV